MRIAFLFLASAILCAATPTPTDNDLNVKRMVLMARQGEKQGYYGSRIANAQANPRQRRTTSPAPASPSGSCTNPATWHHCGEQCGGPGFTGSKCCRPGQQPLMDKYGNSYCSYAPDPTCAGTPYSSSDQRYKQCGGKGWTGSTCCPADFKSFCVSESACYCWPVDSTQCGSSAWQNGAPSGTTQPSGVSCPSTTWGQQSWNSATGNWTIPQWTPGCSTQLQSILSSLLNGWSSSSGLSLLEWELQLASLISQYTGGNSLLKRSPSDGRVSGRDL